MPNISVSVVDGNNITLVTTPTPTQVITIDRGIAGPAGPAGVPGGSTTQVQYNSASNFAGSPNFTFDGVNRITGTNISEGSVMNASPTNSTKSLLVETQESSPVGCFMRPDGLAFYVIGTSGDDINYYALSTAWDISTATFVSASAAVANTAPHDLFFSPDGLNVFIVGATAPATIYTYTLSIPWDISTITLLAPSFDISSLSTAPTGIWFNPTGTKAYLASNTGTPNDAIHYWDVPIPWSVPSFVYGGYISIAAQETNVNSISFSNDGLKFFVVGTSGDDINVYKLSTAWDLTTAVFFTNYTFASMGLTIASPTGMYVSPDGNYAYVINDIASTATVFQLSISEIEWNATGNLNANGNLAVYQNFSVAGQTSLWKASLSGNLGIGATAHPTIRLYSEKTEDGVIAYFRRTGATINPGIQISFAETTNTVLFATAYAGAVSPAITFQTLAGQDRMRIQSNGNVGIGTATPNANLEVSSATGSLTPVPTEVRISTATNASDWSTTLPWGRLGYYSADVSSFGPKLQASIDVISNATSGGSASMIFNTVESSAGALTERVRISNSGDVGIGTGANSLLARLNIQGTDNASGGINIYGAGTNGLRIYQDSVNLNSYITNFQSGSLYLGTGNTSRATLDVNGNLILSTGAFLPYVPAPATTISAATTLTNAQILPQIVVTSGTTFILTMPLGTTLETLIAWPATNIGFNFTVINTASGTITLDATEIGVTSVGTMTVLTGISANFRIRRTAANTFIVYRV
jgi:hypothetical protein